MSDEREEVGNVEVMRIEKNPIKETAEDLRMIADEGAIGISKHRARRLRSELLALLREREPIQEDYAEAIKTIRHLEDRVREWRAAAEEAEARLQEREPVAYAPYLDDDDLGSPEDGVLYAPDLQIHAYLDARDARKAHGPGFGVLPLYAGEPIEEGDDE